MVTKILEKNMATSKSQRRKSAALLIRDSIKYVKPRCCSVIAGATIKDMRYFVISHLNKKPDKILEPTMLPI